MNFILESDKCEQHKIGECYTADGKRKVFVWVETVASLQQSARSAALHIMQDIVLNQHRQNFANKIYCGLNHLLFIFDITIIYIL